MSDTKHITNDVVSSNKSQFSALLGIKVLRFCSVYLKESLRTSHSNPSRTSQRVRKTETRNSSDHGENKGSQHHQSQQVSAGEMSINRENKSSLVTVCESRTTHKHCITDSEENMLACTLKQESWSCLLCTRQQDELALNGTPKIASSVNARPISTNKNRKSVKSIKTKIPYWIKALAIFSMLHLSACTALPTIQSSRRLSSSSFLKLQATDSNAAAGTPLSRRIRDSASSSSRAGRRGRRRLNRDIPEFMARHKIAQQLYNDHSGYFLEITKRGKVQGSREKFNPYTKVKLYSTRTGHVAIYFIESKRFLAMKAKRGKLYGSKTYTKECEFREKMDETRYFTYESALKKSYKRGKGRILSLKNKRAKRAKSINKYSHFAKYAKKTTIMRR